MLVQMKNTFLKYCILLIGAFTSTLSFAQDRGKVEVVKDPRIDTLIARRFSLKSNTTTAALSSTGFRVQIFSGPNRKDAYDAQAKFKDEHPEIKTYVIYHEPYFKVKVGDFRTRLEAEKLKQELQSLFTGLFIIPEKINLPKPETSND
jgi:hypothetical protein